jgi:hypothetical protein
MTRRAQGEWPTDHLLEGRSSDGGLAAGQPGRRDRGADRGGIVHRGDGTPKLIGGRQVGPERPTYRRAWVSSKSSLVPPIR